MKFYPDDYSSGEWKQLELDISDEDYKAFKTLRGRTKKTVLVHDRITDKTYRVRRGPCGLGCYCGAVVVTTREAVKTGTKIATKLVADLKSLGLSTADIRKTIDQAIA
jgi:hypothetical protein